MVTDFIESAKKQFEYYEQLGRLTINQLDSKDLTMEIAEDSNSISIIVKHLHGNMMSRWTNFLSSDGEKEWRDRDGEFEPTLQSRKEILTLWSAGWTILFNALQPLNKEDMNRRIIIRNQEHTVMEAVNRQLCHYSYHVGQIVFIGKVIKGKSWQSLSIPKGTSKAFNQKKFSQQNQDSHFSDDLLSRGKTNSGKTNHHED